ncbi:MAG: alkaline phosphatase [Gammaproteobacteria bacterium]
MKTRLLVGIALSALATTQITSEALAEAAAPRNVILFVGDGMGISTITATRILAGQLAGQTGEEYVLPFERFPNVALVKTYNTDAQVPDSAGTMSAMMTGEKTRIGVFGIRASVERSDCAAALRAQLPTLLEQAEDAGLATGVVTTTRITHATPAATYAHVPNRDWEADRQLPATANEQGCRDIARQMIEFNHGDGIDVMLGGGRVLFLPDDVADPEYPSVMGVRGDDRNLIDEWVAGASERRYVWNQSGFDALPKQTGQVIGLFEPSHLQFDIERGKDGAGEPSLSDMTRFAIERLRQNPRGYFLMIESGKIDHAHHAGNAHRALTDGIALANAVAVADELTDAADTLIVVTADHSHTFTIAGYPKRGNPILGKVEAPAGEPAADAKGRPYTTLGYANGPGYRESVPDLTDVDTTAVDFLQVAGIPMESETHGGEDVAAFARGPNATALRGVIEQNLLYNIMRDALLPADR